MDKLLKEIHELVIDLQDLKGMYDALMQQNKALREENERLTYIGNLGLDGIRRLVGENMRLKKILNGENVGSKE